MNKFLTRFRTMEKAPNVGLVLGLGGLIAVIALVGLIGVFTVDSGGGSATNVAAGGTSTTLGAGGDLGSGGTGPTDTGGGATPGDAGVTTVPGDTGAGAGSAGAGGVGTTGSVGGSGTGGSGSSGSGSTRSGSGRTPSGSGGSATTPTGSSGGGAPSTGNTAGHTTSGVTATEIRWAVHAPTTFDGAPLNLAADPVFGFNLYTRFVNENGGINGRKLKVRDQNDGIFDDRYTVDGAKQAADQINQFQPFFVSGTLGVDQIAIIAQEARKRGYPYLAAGGSEVPFKSIAMYQISVSYDTALTKLAELLGKEVKREGSIYQGRTKVGVTQLDSPYITPSVTSFKNALAQNGLQFVGAVTIKKPTDQTTYGPQIAELSSKGAQIVVPAQDPISTSRMVAECQQQRCGWEWSFANFAHDSDTALGLMNASVSPTRPGKKAWAGVRGLSAGCYYLAPEANDPAKCGQLGVAHQQWQKYYQDSDSNNGWVKRGSGGVTGYQIVHAYLGAMKALGKDVYREGFVANLNNYSNYNDLVTAPITYKGSSNLSHGAEAMAAWEAPLDGSSKYSMISPGFVSKF